MGVHSWERQEPRRNQERHFWQGWGLACVPVWSLGDLPVLEPAWERSRGILGLPGEAEPRRPVMGGRWLVPSTAQAAGEWRVRYKYISGVNAREEKSYFS